MERSRQVVAEPSSSSAGATTPTPTEKGKKKDDSWEYRLRKYLLLLATLVATVTYGAAFNPPGGVWQNADPAANVIAGDPIIRKTSYRRYLIFFYSNATAFASSLVVIVIILILAVLNERHEASLVAPLRILRVVMVLDLFSLMGAYAAGTFRDSLTAIYSSLLLAGIVVYLAIHMALALLEYSRNRRIRQSQTNDTTRAPADDAAPPVAGSTQPAKDDTALAKLRKALMLLATFAVSVTYVAGLSAPGGFWDHEEGGHKPGDAILKGGPHDRRLKAFFVCNTTAFVASLIIIIILQDKRLSFSRNFKSFELYGFIAVTLMGLVGAYSAGSCRQIDTTIYVNSLVGAVIVFILVQAALHFFQIVIFKDAMEWKPLKCICDKVSGCLLRIQKFCLGEENASSVDQQKKLALEKARSLVLLLATLATAITYQAGLTPPGGLWQDDDSGGLYKAGDPILLTTNPRRYKAFYYSNSVAFVASLVAILLVRMKTLHYHNALEAAMILDLLGLITAYAAGSCRDVTTSIYAMGLAGAVLVYVVIHVVMFTLDHMDDGTSPPTPSSLEEQRKLAEKRRKRREELEVVEKRRKRLLLFAILAATITYQAGLTPPGGFLQTDDKTTGHRTGDPVLLNNYPRRYTAFFYCNSVSFMLSIALIILLVNPNMYRPAIRTNALSVCTAAGLIGIMGAYAAGCTQHLKTSIYIFALAGFVFIVVLVVVVYLAMKEREKNKTKDQPGSISQGRPAAAANGNTTGSNKGEENKSSGTTEITPDLEAGRNGAVAAQPSPGGSSTATDTGNTTGKDDVEKKLREKRKFLMLLGILVASITYQAGLAPPGGTWQSNLGGHAAGDPVMHDNRRHRYLAFFYSNSTSFVASVVVIVLLLPPSMPKKWWPWWLGVMNATIVLDLLGLLIAYAAGSSRSWKTAGYVSALVIAVLAYFVVHVLVSCFVRIMDKRRQEQHSSSHSTTTTQQNPGTNGQSPSH
ncbi:hypothetical protein HU200_053617 [Digitaria exilis]|uniref:PGG domain-containing protein n=1 Tax=Digitaria exilis TaxID=1010633 RepID=A0A835ARY4_9POAL|nr:hypothetical protein HU200_053617 [Digitaria exilis]